MKEPLFNARILAAAIQHQREAGVELPVGALAVTQRWLQELKSGALSRLTESQAEQIFNSDFFGRVLGYVQPVERSVYNFAPKRNARGGRHTPDFVIGEFDASGSTDRWTAVGEIKDARTDLDQPQTSRSPPETPVEQAFRYATQARAGVDWVIVSNFRSIRLYRNGYATAYHQWDLEELVEHDRLIELFCLLRPAGLIGVGGQALATKIFQDSLNAGRALTEGFYALYQEVQAALVDHLSTQSASAGLTAMELQGKAHKLLNRILFIAFCEDHPAELLPRNILATAAAVARGSEHEGSYWEEYKKLFGVLNDGGEYQGHVINAFNGGLFRYDPYFEEIILPNILFERTFQCGRGAKRSRAITGIFGFYIYDFAEDLTVQALGQIFEQSLKDVVKGASAVRGIGEVDISVQQNHGVYYTPPELTKYITARAVDECFNPIIEELSLTLQGSGKTQAVSKKRRLELLDALAGRVEHFRAFDPSCGSGAFLVSVLAELHKRYERINTERAAMRGNARQRSLVDIDRLILRNNLHGQDILDESVEISRLSVWLRTARKREALESLADSITVGDTTREAPTTYDLVIGNPPWGAELDGWSESEIRSRFPTAGNEKDSYAIFVVRAWEILNPGGVLAFVIPNSWLTTSGYEDFRRWMLDRFHILELTNLWRIFTDVNNDACILIARKRSDEAPAQVANGTIQIRALPRGASDAIKRERLAENDWWLDHKADEGFLRRQEGCRFEVIYPPKVADEIDLLTSRCSKLGDIANITVGIQAYHHTRVSKEFIRRKGFHANYRSTSDFYPYREGKDAQRYSILDSTEQWLEYSENLHDKRDLQHYAEPRILVQQIFSGELFAAVEDPKDPVLYMSSLFSVSGPTAVPLNYLLVVLNSRITSAIYERRANRLFGDNFPKISGADLASVPIPIVGPRLCLSLSRQGIGLQEAWSSLRLELKEASEAVRRVSGSCSITAVDEFWAMSPQAFASAIRNKSHALSASDMEYVEAAHMRAKAALNRYWPKIAELEEAVEAALQKAFRLTQDQRSRLLEFAPKVDVALALRGL